MILISRVTPNVTPEVTTGNTKGNTINLTSEQLELIVQTAVEKALLKVMPLIQLRLSLFDTCPLTSLIAAYNIKAIESFSRGSLVIASNLTIRTLLIFYTRSHC